ncbi:hypothetical protein QBC35DRAFT_504119 [Podospora australis]|uniref:Vacuolar protein sorting-associated protein n=1 Tax=Podospora australis TaxID=1536484 RepID=A0AAN6WNM1_9PEZI|nr:hypothetical protein QBC35DRAFT_504119 [Podospora australis]
MAYGVRRLSLLAAFFASIIFVLWAVPKALKPVVPDEDESERDKKWIDSSPNFFDRQTCRWLGLCGITHIKWDAPALLGDGESMMEELSKLALGWSEAAVIPKTGESSWEVADLKKRNKRDAKTSGKILQEIPDYVLLNAPLVHLYSGENFWPSDMAEHVKHLFPVEGDLLMNSTKRYDLNNLGQLNAKNGTIFLTSEDDVESRPDWLHSRVGVPAPFEDDDEDIPEDGERGSDDSRRRYPDGSTWWDVDKENPPHRIAKPKILERNSPIQARKRSFEASSQQPMVWKPTSDSNKPDPSGYSKAPAVLVLVDKGSGILDAFWFFFYSYNLGQTVLKIRFGNHVGDWEHCMIRFQDGIPRAMFLSEHAGGKAYTWHAMEKREQKDGKPPRPVIYSAVGSHAMYADPGLHPYVLPMKILKDVTDKGPLWDPALNQYAFWYDYEVDHEEETTVPRGGERISLQPAASNPDAPTSWFHFEGAWGDDVYPLSDNRQWRLFGEYHYTTGPLGPKWKFLERRKVCQTEKCTIVDSIEAGKKSAWY